MLSFWPSELMNGVSGYVGLLLILAIAATGGAIAIYASRSREKSNFRQAPGSRILLSIGEQFAPSDRFVGFVHEESGASIVIMELAASAFGKMQKLGDAAETFAAQGVSGVMQLMLPNRHGDYIYLRGEQNTPLVEYAKYILIFRTHDLTGMVTANIPRAALTSGILTGAEIEKILSSATAGPPKAPEGQELFALSYLGPFEEDQSLLGTTKGYRLKSAVPDELGWEFQPVFLVAPSLTRAPIPNLGLFAERNFESIDQLRDKNLETTHNIEVAGLPAIEALGHGLDIRSGSATLVYQLVVEARHGGYFRILGMAPNSARERFLPEFRRMAQSFRPTP